MPTTAFMDDGGDGYQSVTANRMTWGAVTSGVSIENTIVNTGPCSLKCDSGAGNAVVTVRKAGILADAGRRLTQYRYFSALPTADAGIITSTNSANTTTIWRLQLRTTGLCRFVGSANGADGTVTIPTVQQVRISVAYTITDTTHNEFRAWMDVGNGPVLIATATNLTLAAVGSNQLLSGYATAPGANIVTYIDDTYVDTGSTLDDIGETRVTYKAPTTNNANTFDTTVGTGAVNERPDSITNGVQHAANGTTATANWNIQAQEVGDIDLTGATIRDYSGWLLAQTTSGSDSITLNGVDTALPTAGTSIVQSPAGATTYPTNAAAIGMHRTVASATDALLYECGIMFAFYGRPGVTLYGRPAGVSGQGQMQQLLAQ